MISQMHSGLETEDVTELGTPWQGGSRGPMEESPWWVSLLLSSTSPGWCRQMLFSLWETGRCWGCACIGTMLCSTCSALSANCSAQKQRHGHLSFPATSTQRQRSHACLHLRGGMSDALPKQLFAFLPSITVIFSSGQDTVSWPSLSSFPSCLLPCLILESHTSQKERGCFFFMWL